GPGGPFGGGPHGPGMAGEKAKDFKGTFRRLTRYLKPHTGKLMIVLIAAILSTIFSIVSPKILGDATTILFKGFMAKMQGVPGAGIDFDAIRTIMLWLAGLYLLSSLFAYIQQYVMAGVAQRTVYDLRKEVYNKLGRLPLKYFDARTHGETLSRGTNDMDNI
ncbi:ABC transporter ATP-binding protein, partial [Clostridium perfringens]